MRGYIKNGLSQSTTYVIDTTTSELFNLSIACTTEFKLRICHNRIMFNGVWQLSLVKYKEYDHMCLPNTHAHKLCLSTRISPALFMPQNVTSISPICKFYIIWQLLCMHACMYLQIDWTPQRWQSKHGKTNSVLVFHQQSMISSL